MAPRTGAVTATFRVVMVLFAVTGNVYWKDPAFTKLGDVGATPFIVKKFAATPVRVDALFGTMFTVAV